MKTLIKTSLFLAVIAFASPALADESGLSLGLRASYGIPLGTAGDGVAFNELTAGAIPVQLDVGYRLDSHWLVGGYFSWGYARIADEAKTALEATGATDVGGHAVQRVGLQGQYRFSPLGEIVPWVGLAFGYEWTRYAELDLSAAAGGKETELGLGGFEGTLQLGGDYRLTPAFSVGPFATFSLGQFGEHLATEEGPGAANGDVNETALHQWLQLGIKGTFDL